MSRLAIARAFAFGTFLFLFAGHLTKAQQAPEWAWKDASGKRHTRSELDDILRKHAQWIKSDRKSGSQADLSDANLTLASLTGASLKGANLYSANLNGANLSGANLADADLYSAYVGHAIFEPKSLPALRGIAAANGLELLTYDENPYALAQLRGTIVGWLQIQETSRRRAPRDSMVVRQQFGKLCLVYSE